MSSNYVYTSKTEHYLRVKKPLLERQRRARVNRCLDALKTLIADLQQNDAIMRMDKAEMLESTIAFMRVMAAKKRSNTNTNINVMPPMDSFRNGYMNAVNEISRVMAATPGMSVDIGKSVMTHLGCEFNRLLERSSSSVTSSIYVNTNSICSSAPMSPASSGYHSDTDEISVVSPVKKCSMPVADIWRPW